MSAGPQGKINTQGVLFVWDEYENAIVISRPGDAHQVTLDYTGARQLYLALSLLFGSVSYPEVH